MYGDNIIGVDIEINSYFMPSANYYELSLSIISSNPFFFFKELIKI